MLDAVAFDAVARALEPLAECYLRAGLGAGEFLAAAKYAFIKAAATTSATGGKLNISAIAVATGLTRKETGSILDSSRGQLQPVARDKRRQRTTRVIQGWRTDPAFIDRAGQPARLPIRGAGASFEVLVKRYGGDVTPVSVLNELQRSGLVTQRKDGAISLRGKQPNDRTYRLEAINSLAGQLHDLASTLVDNLERGEHPVFTGFRETKGLPPDVAAVFIKTFTERSAMLLDSVERWFALQPPQRQPAKSGEQSSHRVGIGVYLVDEPAGSRKPMPPRRQHQRKPKVPPAV
jgi:Family of unknown function (DUF6502)